MVLEGRALSYEQGTHVWHIRQSGPDSGRGIQAEVSKPFEDVPLRSEAAMRLRRSYWGTMLIKNADPPQTTIGA